MAGSGLKLTDHNRSTLGGALNLQGPTDHLAPVVHDLEAEALPSTTSRILRDSYAVILDPHDDPLSHSLKTNIDLRGAAVFDRIVHRFLSDAIRIRCNIIVVD